MTIKVVDKMSDDDALNTVFEVCDGLKDYVANNPQASKLLLKRLIKQTLEPLSEQGVFGSEGWEHAFGVE